MMTRRRHARLCAPTFTISAAAVALALVLSACGGDDSGDSKDSPPQKATSADECPEELNGETAKALVSQSAPALVADNYVSVFNGRLYVGEDARERTSIEHTGLTLEGVVGDDLLLSFTSGTDGLTLQRTAIDGDVVWEVELEDAGSSVAYDPSAGSLEVRQMSVDGDDRFFSVTDGSEVEAPAETLDSLTLDVDGKSMVNLAANDALIVWGDLDIDGSESFIVTDPDKENERSLTPSASSNVEACGTTLYTRAPESSTVEVWDASDRANEPKLIQTLDLPDAEGGTGLVVGPGYLAVERDGDNWYVVTS